MIEGAASAECSGPAPTAITRWVATALRSSSRQTVKLQLERRIGHLCTDGPRWRRPSPVTLRCQLSSNSNQCWPPSVSSSHRMPALARRRRASRACLPCGGRSNAPASSRSAWWPVGSSAVGVDARPLVGTRSGDDSRLCHGRISSVAGRSDHLPDVSMLNGKGGCRGFRSRSCPFELAPAAQDAS